MFEQITYYLIFGLPLIIYLGIVTILFFFITATTALLKRKGKLKGLSIQWHFRLAYISLTLAIIHGVLGFSAYL
jgi:cytochrome b561